MTAHTLIDAARALSAAVDALPFAAPVTHVYNPLDYAWEVHRRYLETYGAGRFLTASAPKAGSAKVVLDFNLAQNPPCAFTPYATCPLVMPRNVLPERVEAGEKVPAGH